MYRKRKKTDSLPMVSTNPVNIFEMNVINTNHCQNQSRNFNVWLDRVINRSRKVH
jgi:hypothetical protein